MLTKKSMWDELPSELRWRILTRRGEERARAAITIQTAWRALVARFVYRLSLLAIRMFDRAATL